MRRDRRPAGSHGVGAGTVDNRIRMIRTVVETEELIACGIKSVNVFIDREDCVVVSALAVLRLMEDGGTDNFHFTGGEVALEVALIIIRIPEAPFNIREQFEILCGIRVVCQADLHYFACIVQRYKGDNGRFHIIFG